MAAQAEELNLRRRSASTSGTSYAAQYLQQREEQQQQQHEEQAADAANGDGSGAAVSSVSVGATPGAMQQESSAQSTRTAQHGGTLEDTGATARCVQLRLLISLCHPHCKKPAMPTSTPLILQGPAQVQQAAAARRTACNNQVCHVLLFLYSWHDLLI